MTERTEPVRGADVAKMVEEAREREQFEAHIRKDCGDLSTFGSGKNVHYHNSAVNNAWCGWMARARLAAPVAPRAVTVASLKAGQGHGDAMAEAAIRALGIHVDSYTMDKVLKALAPFLASQAPASPAEPSDPAPRDVHRDEDAAADEYEREYWADKAQQKADVDARRGALQLVRYYVYSPVVYMASAQRNHIAALSAQTPGEGWQHVAYAEDGELHWMSGRKFQNCELYAPPLPKPPATTGEAQS